MERLELFPTDVFVFYNKNIDNQSLIEKLERLDNVQVKKSTTLSMLVDLRHHEDFKDLFNWFRECLEEIRVKQQYDCDKFEITNSWFNVALAGYDMYQNYHRHSMSFFSAVYYLTDGSPTIFEDPVIHRTQAEIEVLRMNYEPWIFSDAEPGKLIIFPSWLYHSSKIHLGESNRYIISFNSLPTGKINYNLATDSKVIVRIDNE